MKKLHLICNSHIDTIWQWEWGEGMSATLSTFQSAANLAKKHDYIFCHNESSLYKYTAEYAPELFETIRELVRCGKWNIMGGWYLQPDCLLGNGESYIRQIREGMLFFREHFPEAEVPRTAFCVDAFGHSRGLVQIVKKCGQEHYILVRPYSKFIRKQIELPGTCFLWEGYDGSCIKALHSTEYASCLGVAADKVRKDIERLADEEVAASLWGVGNHGGGPSDKDLTDIAQLIAESDIEIVHSTPDAFFAEVDPQAKWSRSLISCMPGCYSSMLQLKQRYRMLERELFFTEKMLSIAELKGIRSYPLAQMKGITEDLLTVMFHDVLPGTTIKAGEDNALHYIDHGLKELELLKLGCFFGMIKGQPVAEEGTYPIFVFNPKPYGGAQLVECELSIIPTELFEEEYSQLEIYDEQGNKVPCQTVKEASNISIDWRKRVVFYGHLEPLSVTRFTARTVVRPQRTYSYGSDICFENGCKSVHISAETGLIDRYCVDGVDYAAGGMFELYSYDDTADPYAMSDRELQEGIGTDPEAFRLLREGDGVFSGLHSMEIIEDGDIYLAVEAFFASGMTRARIGYKIYKDGPAVDIDVDLFPAEINKCIKLHIPVQAQRYIGQQIFGTEELYMDGRECVAHNFVALQKGEEYLQLLTPDTYGSSYADGSVRLTLHRSVTYLAHPQAGRPLMRENIFLPKIDMAQQSYRIRMLPAREEALQRNADVFAERPFALNIFPTVDTKADNGYSVRIDNPDIAMVTMLHAQETQGHLIRLQNNAASPACATLYCGTASIHLSFGRYEVKTVRLYNNELQELSQFLI